MSGLGLFVSEDLDSLVARYVERLTPTEDPLARPTVVVPNSAVGQWFEQAVARRTGPGGGADGVVANVDAIFPSGLLGRLLFRDHRALEHWSVPALALALREHAGTGLPLAEALGRARVLERLVRLRGEDLEERLRAAGLALEEEVVAQRVARGDLWPHAQFARSGISGADLVGPRVSLVACLATPFGSLLPEVAVALAATVPTEAYLGVATRALASASASDGDLVARWGRPARAHLSLWSTAGGDVPEWVDAAPLGASVDVGGVAVSARVEVHRCVGLARQVEVARDVLARVLEEEALAPHEVRIVSLDASKVVPLVDLYFASFDDDGPGVQFEVADPSVARPSPRLDALRVLLRVIESDQTVNDVTELLAQPAVREGLGLRRPDVDRVVELALTGRVSLGLDAHARARRDVFHDDDDAGTWSRFVERVALASVFEPERGAPDEVATLGVPDDLESVTRVADLLATLRDAADELGHVHTLDAWVGLLARWCAVIDHDERVRDPSLERLLGDLTGLATRVPAPLTFTELRDLVESLAMDAAGGSLAGRGGVSLLSLGAASALPYEVTCVIGLDDDLLSDVATAAGELGEARATDPDRRLEARAALVDLLASTRRRLLLFTDDRRIIDGGNIPPSLVLAELLGELSAAGAPIEERYHPRHGFSTGADEGCDLAASASEATSADPVHAEVAATLGAVDRTHPDLDVGLSRVAAPPPAPEPVVEASDLAAFLRTPHRVFLRDVFAGARLSNAREASPDVPYLDVGDGLAQWRERDRLLRDAVETGAPPRPPASLDSTFGSIAAGFRTAAFQELGLDEVEHLAAYVRETLAAVEAERDPRGLRPGLVRGAHRDVARGPVDLYRTTRGPVLFRYLASTRFAAHLLAAVVDVAVVTAEVDEPVIGVVARLQTPGQVRDHPGYRPFVTLQWAAPDVGRAARHVLAGLLRLYDRRWAGLPRLFPRTSVAMIAGGLEGPMVKEVGFPDKAWFDPGFGDREPHGESLEPELRLLVPLAYEELDDAFDGDVGATAREVASVLAPLRVTAHRGDVAWTAVVGA